MPVPRTLTVKELVARLANEDPDARVVFASSYGDRGNTKQVHFLKGGVDETVIKRSGYSDSGWALLDDGDDEEDLPEFEGGPTDSVEERTVLVLR